MFKINKLIFFAAILFCTLIFSGAVAAEDTTELVSVSVDGNAANGDVDNPSISADGRYVAFRSGATNLVENDANGCDDIFVYDRNTKTTELISKSSNGVQANDHCWDFSISGNGRYVAFTSGATNLVENDYNGYYSDVFLHDRQLHTTLCVTAPVNEWNGMCSSFNPSINYDGSYITFDCNDGGFTSDTNNLRDVFLWDSKTGIISRISDEATGGLYPSISADGSSITFLSEDLSDHSIHAYLVSANYTGRIDVGLGNTDLGIKAPISTDGRYVAFQSDNQIYVFDSQTQTNELISKSNYGELGNSINTWPSISSNGRYVSFTSYATNLVAENNNMAPDIFLFDRESQTIKRVSVSINGIEGNMGSDCSSISGDGKHIAYVSNSNNLVPNINGEHYLTYLKNEPSVWATVEGGNYNQPLNIELLVDESQLPSATIYYTTNGDDPITSSTQYNGPINLKSLGQTVLKFFAVDNATNTSPIYSETYYITDITPPNVSTNHDEGFFNTNPLSIELSASDDLDPEPEIYYWLNESEQTLYTGPIFLSELYNYLTFYAVDNSGNISNYYYKNYTIDTIAPTADADPKGDIFNGYLWVYLFANDNLNPETAIYYTTDGSNPTNSSTRYIETVDLSPIYFDSLGEHELKFIAVDAAGNISPVYKENYNIIDVNPPEVYLNYIGGSYNIPLSIEISAQDNFDPKPQIYYTLNGDDPKTSSNLYTEPIDIPEGETTLKFFAIDSSGNSSPINTKYFTIDTTAPTANANPSGDIYNDLSSIELSSNDNIDPEPEIYYTTDGNDPYLILDEEYDIIGLLYDGPISIESAGELILKFFVRDSLGNYSPIYSEIYNIRDNISPTANATPTGETYYDPVSINLQANDNYSGITIYYTLDGTEPNTSSNIYSGPIHLLEGNTTVKFFAQDSSGNRSPIYTEEYNLIDNAPPVVSANPTSCIFQFIDIFGMGVGYYNNYVQLFANDMDPNPLIYYTLDGSDPTTGGTLYNETITTPFGKTILKFYAIDHKGHASAVKTETYYLEEYRGQDLNPPTVTANLQGGIYNSPRYLELVANDVDDPITGIYYTLDGSDPFIINEGGSHVIINSNAFLYTAPFLIDKTTMLKFTAKNMAGILSPIYFDIFIIGNGSVDNTPPTVTASENGGLYNTTQTISLHSSEAGHIYYTLNGETPNTSSAEYIIPIDISTTTTLKFFAIDMGGNASPIYTENYKIDTTKPEAEADVKTGSYNTVQFVNLSINEAGRIYYTTNGSTPTTSSNPYIAPLAISKTTTLKFIVVDEAGNQSDEYTENYKIDTTPPTAQANIPGGSYNTPKTVTLSSNESGHIYYTLNGATPTINSTVYTKPLNITTTTTLKFSAIDDAGNISAINTESYKIDTTPPTAQVNIQGGSYNTSKTVTLSSNEPGHIYYTLNGATPTSNSTKYTKALNITSTTTLKFIAIDEAGNSSPVYTQKYVIDKVAPKISSTTPTNYKTKISRTTIIYIKFTENIKNSAYFNYITMKNLTTGKNIIISKAIKNNILNIKSSKLAANTWYQVTIPTKAVKDYAGNQLSSLYAFKFKTGS